MAGPDAAGPARLGPGGWALLLAAFLGAALSVYRPALEGPFVSDDFHYVANNPYIHELGFENLVALADPFGPATRWVVNYAPLSLLLHSLAWQAFGPEVLGHHLLNIILHSVASVLLVGVFLGTGIPRAAAILGGALFLLHPANVESVAWISQLKTSSALVLSLSALLAYPRRPLLASVCFALALLAKATAAYALPVALLLEWTRGDRVRWGWMGVWSLLLLAYAIPEFATHQRSGAADAALLGTPLVLLRTICAIAMRYLVMAATSYGVAAFQEPEPARSLLDPWWLASLPTLALLGWRVVVVARARRPELCYWAWALVSFAPVSQVFPFLYPMADRYLYFILPGLIGAALLAAAAGIERLASALAPTRRREIERAALALGIGLALFFTLGAWQRAPLWRSSALLLADAAAQHPEGKIGLWMQARRAALAGDSQGVIDALRGASEKGYNRLEELDGDPSWDIVRDHPEFRALLREIAAGWIDTMRRKSDLTQRELRLLARAYVVRGELPEALDALQRALDQGGALDPQIRGEIAAVQAAIASGTGVLHLGPGAGVSGGP